MQEEICKKATLPMTPGTTCKHYKGKLYKILMLVHNSETDNLEPWIVYQGLYNDPQLGNEPIFTRSLDAFMQTIIIDGVEQPRFSIVSPQ